jgi:ATP-dependent exoDNAse (exonuclease V) alpha subunit
VFASLHREEAHVAHVTPIGSDQQQIEYGLSSHGCTTAVVADAGLGEPLTGRQERPLRWIGEGLHEVGIQPGSELREEDFWMARSLVLGLHPRTGERLVEAKLAVPPDAKVPLAPLVHAVQGLIGQRGTSAEQVVGSKRLAGMYARAVRAVNRRGEAATLRADHAGQLADVAGLDVDKLWGPRFATALANLTELVPVPRPDGSVRYRRVPRRITAGKLAWRVEMPVSGSDSLLLAVAPEATADRVESIFADNAVEVFGWLEGTCAYGLRGHHGDGERADRVDGSGFLGWVMTHRAARPVEGRVVGDPHWHVHITIANLTYGEDGKWSTVAAGGRDLMRHMPAADMILHALVRRQLHHDLGVEYARNPRTGRWEVAAIPDAALVHFSKRGVSIQEMLADMGFDPKEASRAAQRVAESRTRRPKTEATLAPDSTLRKLWQDEARAHGFDVDRIAAEAFPGAAAGPIGQPSVEQIATVLADPKHGLTANKRRFSRADALAAVADQLPHGAGSIEEIETLTDQVLARADFTQLGQAKMLGSDGGRYPSGAPHMSNAVLYTTTELIEVEAYILARAEGSRATPVHAVVDGDRAQLAIQVVEAGQGFPLAEEQRAAVVDLVTSDRPIDTAQGGPGGGKSTMMRSARVAWEAAGLQVAGASTQAAASHNLFIQAAIPSRSIAQWLWAIDNGDGLAGLDVLVADEAAMGDDRARARLYRDAEEHDVKIVEVGDQKQLRGVGCGSMFGYLHSLLGGPELTGNRRQADEDERAIIAAWRQGRYLESLQGWAGKDRVVATETSREAVTAMVTTWMRLREGCTDQHIELQGLVMLAATNEQVDQLNAAAQAVRDRLGQLGTFRDFRLLGGRSLRLHVGDQVALRINSRGERLHVGDDDVFNGYRGVIDHIAGDGSVTVSWVQDGPGGPAESTAILGAE